MIPDPIIHSTHTICIQILSLFVTDIFPTKKRSTYQSFPNIISQNLVQGYLNRYMCPDTWKGALGPKFTFSV